MCLATVEQLPDTPLKRKSRSKEVWRRYRKNKLAVAALVVLVLLVTIAFAADYIAPYGENDQDIVNKLQHPSSEHLLGTDHLGRDLLSRLIYGTRSSLRVGLTATLVSACIGSFLGAVAGYFGGKIDNIIMRFIDVLLGIPNMLLAIILTAILGPGLTNCMIAMGISTSPNFGRLVRAQVLSESGKEYVEAEKAINATHPRIIFNHIIPNVLSTIIVQITMGVAGAILMCAALSFIGLGAQAPTAEWGAMLSEGRSHIRNYGYLCTFPGIAIMLTVFSLNIIGDGLRDALDPRLKN